MLSVGGDDLFELVAGETTCLCARRLEQDMDERGLEEEVIVVAYFIPSVGQQGHRFIGRLLEYTVGSSNIAQTGAVLLREWGEVTLIKTVPPLFGFAVSE